MPPDNAATVAVGSAVQFPRVAAMSAGGTITKISSSTFNLSTIGTYKVFFQVSVDEAGQLELDLNGAGLPYTVVGRATGTSQIVGESLVTTTIANSVVSVINPPGNATALTVTPLAGGTLASSATLIIEQL